MSILKEEILEFTNLRRKITSKHYKKILIATDGSEHTEKAITHAIELAKLTKAELHAVYVISLVYPLGTLEIKSDSVLNRTLL